MSIDLIGDIDRGSDWVWQQGLEWANDAAGWVKTFQEISVKSMENK
jgi:hypothetical protein